MTTCLACARPTRGLYCEACRTGERAPSDRLVLQITPVAKPRMTRRDQWQKRDVVVRYRAYCDALRAAAERQGFALPDAGARMVFHLPMPPSWSKKRRAAMDGEPHQQKPDLDNLVKAVCDALRPDGDAQIWHMGPPEKRWARVGRVEITIEPVEVRRAA